MPKLILHRLKWFVMRRLGISKEYLGSLDSSGEPKWFVETITNWRGTFIDVGAGVGEYLLKTNAEHVYGFEPDIRAYRQIMHRLENVGERITVFRTALSDRNGDDYITITNGILQSTLSLQRHGEKLRTETKKLDTVVFTERKIVPEGPVLIKLDTEGHEHKILQGGLIFLEVFRPVILVEYHENLKDVCRVLKQRRYRVVRHQPDRYSDFQRGWMMCSAE
ncbi:MAG: FkbM family methyltransferase [Candidatus Caldarchaeum sp.]